MKNIVTLAMVVSTSSFAGFGGMGNVESSDEGGSIGGPVVLVVLAGAAIGYFVERAFNKVKMDKSGSSYTSEYLGGKAGAIVGAVLLPLLIGFFR